MYALVSFADSEFNKSALCSGCSFNFHFYIYSFICIFFPIVINFAIKIINLRLTNMGLFYSILRLCKLPRENNEIG